MTQSHLSHSQMALLLFEHLRIFHGDVQELLSRVAGVNSGWKYDEFESTLLVSSVKLD
jgi:hypothetical protein